MTGLGTLVNMAAILIGSGIGLLLKNWHSQTAADHDFQRSGALCGLCWCYRRYQRADERIRNYF